MKNFLENLMHLLLTVGFSAIVVMLFIGIAFELPIVTWISGIIGVVSILGGVGTGLYLEEVL
jgi:Sec-independent protein secretion pathway component TatC